MSALDGLLLTRVSVPTCASVPRASQASSKQQLKPLLEELDEALTTQKKLHAISDYTAKNPQRTFNKDEVRAPHHCVTSLCDLAVRPRCATPLCEEMERASRRTSASVQPLAHPSSTMTRSTSNRHVATHGITPRRHPRPCLHPRLPSLVCRHPVACR